MANQERYAFDRLLKVGRTAGFIPATVTAIFDTTNTGGAGAVQDTYTLLRKGIRKLLKTAGFHCRTNGKAWRRKSSACWRPTLTRTARPTLTGLIRRPGRPNSKCWSDAEAALDAILPDCDEDEVRAMGWLLTKILGDDLVVDEQGRVQMGEGTAPDRIISLTDPQMHHGRKSTAHRFDGFKAVVSTEQSSELLLDVADAPAPGSDGQQSDPGSATGGRRR